MTDRERSGNEPLVSIIIRTKDRPKLLRRALKSIVEQTYRPIEIILVNDGGCELDMTKLAEIAADVRINYMRLMRNMGRSYAGNIGIANAKGDLVSFLDDDDELYPNHIAVLANVFRADNGIRVAYSDSTLAFRRPLEKDEGDVITRKENYYSEEFDRDRLLFENYIPFLCLMFDRKVLVNYKFDENLEAQEDWRLLSLVSREHYFHHVPIITCQYNIQGDSFVDYLENRYDIQKNASIVFEKNKELIDWNAWSNFKKRLDGIVGEYIDLKDSLENVIRQYEKELRQCREQRLEELDTSERIEWLSSLYYRGMADLLKAQDVIIETHRLVIRNMDAAQNIVQQFERISLSVNEISKTLNVMSEHVGHLTDAYGPLQETQKIILQRLSISARLSALMERAGILRRGK